MHHEHGHHHGTLAPAAACASVALDIGAGCGALVLYPSERFRGREIEISRLGVDVGVDVGVGMGESARRVHTGVHERRAQERSLLTAVFGSLPAGEYLVWVDDTTPGPVVSVPAGAVAEVRLG
jgi:hypothetical protein